ncbi:flagellar filament capping protein FliD [Candidatus Sulfurimonas marisnigri]|uniref:Flagellar hook-associated protein 2 n=1 Tax=Candidatus Sulfurimonas marisnigri TaxID=2740405 RepID=A0A7S7RQE9_9BACT|nr:flagellar filament capping protein FliD [Candidatus Sulfurimonas marisnigri]QOY54554.1 flagellar filament capping protein FliD [Candidatus Sulfurimonas marisnigri]
MSISSVGVGSGILTQDVMDQLRAADESSRITPIDLNLANEGDKKDALEIIDANMTNLTDAINELKSHALFGERSSDVTGTAVEVVAAANSDIQDFTLTVGNLATKQIEESGAFTASTETIANAAGSMNLNIDGVDFTIDYDATTTLNDFKNAINSVAGEKVDATVVQINSGEFRLFVSSADTGTTQNITMTDNSAALKDTRLTIGLTALQSGVDANFTFNGQAITRTSNNVSDLVTGLDITLKEVGTSSVSVAQNRDTIMEKFDSFVEHYNAAITELNNMTKPSTESGERGIFSSESTIKGMKSSIEDMISGVGGGVGSLFDYGFNVDKDGVMTLNKDTLNKALDDNSTNVEAFFAGGTYTNADLTTTVVDGAFVDMSTIIEGYTKYNATLDQFKTSITESISTLEERKISVTEQLDDKYAILKKQFIAYDLMISRFNSASSMFTQMAEAQSAASN